MIEPGSLVVCINNNLFEHRVKLDTPYEVQEIIPTGTRIQSSNSMFPFIIGEPGIKLVGVYGQEIYFRIGKIFDLPFPLRCFRELQLPGFVAEVLERELQLI